MGTFQLISQIGLSIGGLGYAIIIAFNLKEMYTAQRK